MNLTGLNVSELFGSSGYDGGSSILSALYGTPTATGNPVTALTSAEANQTKDIATTAAEPEVARDIKAFTTAVQGATSVTQLLNNPTVLKVLLTANGLGDQTQYTALAQKALTSSTTDTASVANQLSSTNSAWLAAAKTYQFATAGLSVIQKPSVLSTIANAYAEVTWREGLDKTTPGLSNALTFRAESTTVTSALQVLGDPVMRDVVTTALGLPLTIAEQPLEAQEKAITSQLDVTRFQDPTFTESFIQRYLLAKGSGTGSSSLLV